MKKLFSILFLFTLIIVSCEKSTDSPTVKAPTEITKIADLSGTWIFQSFSHPKYGVITQCPALVDDVLLSFTFNGTKCTITDCDGEVIAKDYTVYFPSNSKVINIIPPMGVGITYIFTIKSYVSPILVLGRNLGTGEYTELTVKKT
jgi:hypothetical protein